jgi:glycosyltransferase involved in cell wall biosynthesis
MRIGIDARFLTHPQCGGFKTYTECLISALAEVDRDNDYVLYVDRPPSPTAVVPRAPNFRVQVVPGSLPGPGLPWREQVALPRQAARDRLDLLHSPALTAPLHLNCASTVTIHDMIWYCPPTYSDRGSQSLRRKLLDYYYKRVPEAAARRAAVILTVSEASKADIVEQLGLPEDAVVVIHEAARKEFRPLDPQSLQAGRQRCELPSEFILGVGSADPRKNIRTLLAAYALLASEFRQRFPLVILLSHPSMGNSLRKQARNLGISADAHFRTVGPTAEAMALYFNAASVFVCPSLCEGFGLPSLEAMACGTPVVAADNSCAPEILGRAALLVDALDPRAIASAITETLTHQTLQQDLIRNGLERAARYSWGQCARETIVAYRKTVAGRSVVEEKAPASGACQVRSR